MDKVTRMINHAFDVNEDHRMLKEEMLLIWERANDWYRGGDTLEIGCYKGTCSYMFATLIGQKSKGGKHYISDTFDSTIGDNDWIYEDHTEEMLLENLGKLSKHVVTIPGETLKNAKEISKRKYDFVWHDGDHSYPNFLNDLRLIDPLTDNIMIHDMGHPQVTQCVDEFCKETGYVCELWVEGKYGLATIIK